MRTRPRFVGSVCLKKVLGKLWFSCCSGGSGTSGHLLNLIGGCFNRLKEVLFYTVDVNFWNWLQWEADRIVSQAATRQNHKQKSRHGH